MATRPNASPTTYIIIMFREIPENPEGCEAIFRIFDGQPREVKKKRTDGK